MLKKTISRKGKVIIIVLFLILGLEFYLRIYWGFCDAILIRKDNKYEYIAQSNQHRFRFRNKIEYNEYSMRNGHLNNDAIKIIGFGDSVINGGSLTDQDSLATTKLSASLSVFYDTIIQVLNISAGSWGPDNCYAYLQKHGDFNAQLIFLVVSSHDAYDNMEFDNVVGNQPNFPDKQYCTALGELTRRYLYPKIIGKSKDYVGINKNKGNKFNSGFENFYQYCKKNRIPLIIYLHPEVSEIEKGAYNEQGEKIVNFASERNIQLIRGMDSGIENSDYLDQIHLTESAQVKLHNLLFRVLSQYKQYNGRFLR